MKTVVLILEEASKMSYLTYSGIW
uniref:Uncharacterized protein n=1 Tax=Rhizophora mucronata TaxID=61149 RepID=A0A2P2MBS8_RHIMU